MSRDWNTKPVIHGAQREDLLDVVAQLVHGGVEPLVLESARRLGAEVNLVLAAKRGHRVTSASRGVDHDPVREPAGAPVGETEFPQ